MQKPLACNMIRDLASMYIKDGVIIKNREGDIGIKADNNLTKWLKNSNNNLAIENNTNINVYCTKHKEKDYIATIQYITNNFNTDKEDKIKIYIIEE